VSRIGPTGPGEIFMTDRDTYAAWLRTKEACYARDKWRCMNPQCKDSHNLQAHHVTYRSHGGPDTLDNLVTLCIQCHEAIHQAKLVILDGDGNARRWSDTCRFVAFKEWRPK
jgi:hypothetical protein